MRNEDVGFYNQTAQAFAGLGNSFGLYCLNIHDHIKDIQATAGVLAVMPDGPYQWGTDMPVDAMNNGDDPSVPWSMPDMIANCQKEVPGLPKTSANRAEKIYDDGDGELKL